MSRSGASVLVAALIAVVELPAARADRGATCTSRLSTALAGLAAAARDAGATVDRLRLEGPAFELSGRAQDRAAGERRVARLAGQGGNSELVRTEAPAGEAQPFTVKGAR